MKKLLVGVIACTALFAGCSADKTDFKKAAEKTIVDELKKTDPAATAVCEDPTATAIGTTFNCTGTVNGTPITLTATITKKDQVTVGPAADTGAPAEEAPADSAPAEEAPAETAAP
jgi:hypothetical protein